MADQWYYARNNQKHGPYSATQLKRLAASGQLQPSDMVWKEGAAKWMAAVQVKGLFAAPSQVRSDTTPQTKAISVSFDNLAEPTPAKKFGRNKVKSEGRKLMVWAGVGGVLLLGMTLLVGYFVRRGSSVRPRENANSLVASDRTSDKAKARAKTGGSQVNDLPPMQPRPLPDFSKVDYSVDFSNANYTPVDFNKLDYTRGPQGQAVVERKGQHPKEKNSPYWGKPYLEHGYMGQNGEFVRHGVMKTWYLGGTSKRRERKFEEVQFYNGKRHGTFIAWDKNGNKEDEGFVVDGKLHGKRTGYYPEGKRKIESYWVGGKNHGLHQDWDKNGKMMGQGAFVDGKQHGKWLHWHPNGAKAGEEFYIDGKLHGPLRSWYPNDQKKVETVFVNGKQEGRRLEWHENGQKETENFYIDGLAQGKNQQWHSNGKVWIEGLWKDGKEEGVWIRWHPNGRKQSQVSFIDGKRQGLLESWYSNGQLDEVATFDHGQKTGKNTRYCPNGRLLFEHQFVSGTPTGLWIEYEGTGSGRVSSSFKYP